MPEPCVPEDDIATVLKDIRDLLKEQNASLKVLANQRSNGDAGVSQDQTVSAGPVVISPSIEKLKSPLAPDNFIDEGPEWVEDNLESAVATETHQPSPPERAYYRISGDKSRPRGRRLAWFDPKNLQEFELVDLDWEKSVVAGNDWKYCWFIVFDAISTG